MERKKIYCNNCRKEIDSFADKLLGLCEECSKCTKCGKPVKVKTLENDLVCMDCYNKFYFHERIVNLCWLIKWLWYN